MCAVSLDGRSGQDDIGVLDIGVLDRCVRVRDGNAGIFAGIDDPRPQAAIRDAKVQRGSAWFDAVVAMPPVRPADAPQP